MSALAADRNRSALAPRGAEGGDPKRTHDLRRDDTTPHAAQLKALAESAPHATLPRSEVLA